MQIPQQKMLKILITFILSFDLFFFGCTNIDNVNANSNQKNTSGSNESVKTNPANDNMGDLLDLVQLPELPEEVVWREEAVGKVDNRVPGPTDKKITAVLQYTPENAAKLIAIIEKNRQPEKVEIDTESWFPEELTAQAQMAGNDMLKGTAYGANQFYNIPYSSGRIIRIEGTDFFVLELFAQ